jgi:integrase/recombinase XerD
MRSLAPKRHPEALKGASQIQDLGEAGGGPLYAAFSEARKAASRVGIGQAVESYLAYLVSKGCSPHTVRSHRNLLAAFYRHGKISPSTPLVAITPEAVEAFMLKLFARYSPGTAWSYSRRLLALFRVFAAGGLILENPFVTLDPPPKPKPLMGPVLSRDEVRALFASVRHNHPAGIRNRAILEVFYSAGLRLSECSSLHLDDLDLAKGLIAVRGGKGAKDRVVPLGSEAVKWVRRYLAEVRPRWASKDEDALWIGLEGRPVSSLWIQRTVRRLGRRAKINKPVTPHTLRRTFATHLLAGGASAWIVKEILGHVTTQTLGRYIQIAPEELKHVREKTHPRR